MKKALLLIYLAAIYLAMPNTVQAQCINCGTGADGAYNATSNTTLAGGTYNYTTFTIQSGVTVTVTGTQPLIIRATGAVSINGTLSVNGGNGQDGITYSTSGLGGIGVAGGANGGNGVYSDNIGPLDGATGSGLGGANTQGQGWSGGGGAGYGTAGSSSGGVGGFAGVAYGDAQLTTLYAGSGGGGGSGGYSCGSGGGGAGGGIISITSCTGIAISAGGAVTANGGNGGSDGNGNCGGGGGGSGGAIWLTATTISNSGTITAAGGNGGASAVSGNPYYGTGATGAVGRIRVDGTFTGTASIPVAVPGNILTATASSSAPVICTTPGQASVVVTNGSTPYSYIWSNGEITSSITVATAGNYTVTVTDNSGCSVTAATTVASNNAILSGSVNTTAVNCNGESNGTASISVTGGTNPYTFTWSNSDVNNPAYSLVAGQYTVTVTDNNGCTGAFSGTVTEPAALTATVIADSVNCHGESNGSIVVTVSGGTGNTGIAWSGGLNGFTPANLAAGNYGYTITDQNGCTLTGTTQVGEPNVFALDINVTNATCQGESNGSAEVVVVSGGTGAIAYLWSNSATTTSIQGLAEGQIGVAGQDANGCTATAANVVGFDNNNPVVDLGNDIAQCGGQVVLDAQNSGSAYNWSDASTGQTVTITQSGTTGVTVTDNNGCTAADDISVTINALPVVDLGNDIAQCGGQVVLDAQNSGSTYNWSDASTGQTVTITQSGITSVTVTDNNGCTAADEVSVTINALPVVDLGNDIAQCGGEVVLDAQNSGGTYNWSDASTGQTVTITQSGTTSVTVTDNNGCTAADEVSVTINAVPAITFNAPAELCAGAELVLTATPAGGTFSGNGVSGTNLTAGTVGTQHVVSYSYTDGNSCSATAADTVYAIQCVGINETGAVLSLNVYPNPNSGSFVITTATGIDADITITNQLGQLLNTFALNAVNNYNVVVTNLAAGTYFVTCKTNGAIVSKKVLIME